LRSYRKVFLSYGASNNVAMAKQVFVHTRLSRAYLALARLSCFFAIDSPWLPVNVGCVQENEIMRNKEKL